MTRNFELMGIRCEVFDSTSNQKLLRELESDLPALLSTTSSPVHFRIQILGELAEPSFHFKLSTSLGELRIGKIRSIRFLDGGFGVFDFKSDSRSAQFTENVSVDVIENYMAATWGELLEKRGVMRLHAAGFVQDGGTEIYVAKSGAGKSTLISRILGRGEKIFSDEIVLVEKNFAHAFPLPIALEETRAHESKRRRRFLGSTKPIYSVERNSVASPAKVERIVFVTDSIFVARHLEWIFTVTLGLGLPQMKEYLVRSNSCGDLFRFAVRRFAFALTILATRRLVFQCENSFRSRP
ncbi:MAG: hypothetical protein V4692_15030 [Bdellovibrionota bacterium]